jgi:hypothetical protein
MVGLTALAAALLPFLGACAPAVRVNLPLNIVAGRAHGLLYVVEKT